MNDYLKYQERLNELVKKKKDLEETIEDKKQANRLYLRLWAKEKLLRQELMNLIPNHYTNLKK